MDEQRLWEDIGKIKAEVSDTKDYRKWLRARVESVEETVVELKLKINDLPCAVNPPRISFNRKCIYVIGMLVLGLYAYLLIDINSELARFILQVRRMMP